MTNQNQNSKNQKYDLVERTAIFGEQTILFLKNVPKDEITRPLINQLVRSSTSVGANYMEADEGQSRKDFIHKIAVCKKEARECIHWFRMLSVINPIDTEACSKLSKEAHELVLIFAAIQRRAKENQK